MKYIYSIIFSIRDIMFRFRLEFAVVVLATIVALTFFGPDVDINDISQAIKLFLLCIPAFALFLTTTLYSEKNNIKNTYTYLTYGLITVGLAGYYLMLPNSFKNFSIEYIRYFILVLSSIIAVFFIPHIKTNNQIVIWNYIKMLIFRAIISGFFAVVLYLGIAIVFNSIDYLFGIDVNPQFYVKTVILVFILFMFLFFLGGINNEDNEEIFYPKLNKIFTEYILIPLVSIYGLILYAYGIKIIFTWNWPEGGVIWLNIWFFVLGLAVFIITKPLQYSTPRVKKYIKIFSIASIPLVVLYFLAIWLRLQDYGITINRYYIILFGLWIAFISLYNSISKINSLKVILGSFISLLVLSSFGTWGSLSIAKSSQYDILIKSLSTNNMLQNGKMIKASSNIDQKDKSKIGGSLSYLIERYGLETIKDITPNDLYTKLSDNKRSTYTTSRTAQEYLNIGYTDSSGRKYFYLKSNYETELVEIGGYNFIMNINDSYKTLVTTGANNISIKYNYNNTTGILSIEYNKNGTVQSTTVNIADIAHKTGNKYGFINDYTYSSPINEFTIQGESPFNYKLVLKHISGNIDTNNNASNEIKVSGFDGILLIK